MKPLRIVFCLALCVFWALPADGFALTAGSPYKPGSVMIFPLIDGSKGADTVIAITNGFYQGVDVACRYRTVTDDVGGLLLHRSVWYRLVQRQKRQGLNLDTRVYC
jgi:hypothetical protein